MSIANGDRVTYYGTWPKLGLLSDYFTKVLADLSANSGLAIRGQSGGPGISAALLGENFSVQLDLVVQNGLGFSSTDDIVSIIRHYVFEESGNYPIIDSIPFVNGKATGQPQGGVSAPSASGGGQFACGDPSWSFIDAPAQWFQCLTQKGLSTLGLVFIGLLVGIAFIVFAEKKVL
jgi:hypothetical protein